MSEQQWTQGEEQLVQIARAFPYPTTPVLLARPTTFPRQRRQPLQVLALAIAVIALFVLALIFSPRLRATVTNFWQIGVVRLFLPEVMETPTAEPVDISTPAVETPVSTTPIQQPIQQSSPWPPLAGETLLVTATAQLPFPVRLPTYPPDLGPPDRVFLQRRNGLILILLWMAPEKEQARLALFQMGSDAWISKGDIKVLARTTVHGHAAAWVEGVHILQMQGEQEGVIRLVGENVLVWVEQINGESVTYRLESDLLLEEAVRIGESLE
ncbi:MAG: hypothetical protein HY328_06420 [Chloroflexi bacterium]|nr:hypothetical protein [Chloroflexota bacterium]